MNFLRISAGLGLWMALCLGAWADDVLTWPGSVSPASSVPWSVPGPFLFNDPKPNGGRVSGLRPFYLRWTRPTGDLEESTVLYPLFYYRTYDETYEWSFFKLITHYGRIGGGPPATDAEPHTFDIWPIYFSRDSGDPATSDHAVFPLYGRIRERFGLSDFSWALFPIYAHSNNHQASTTWVPWPILHVTTGAIQGFGLWPLYGHETRPGYYERQYALWPIFWNTTTVPAPDSPPGTPPSHSLGILPFYTLDRSPAVVSENYLWPFFGYSDRVAPFRYHEDRYFWPFLVQGRGEDHYVNRWGPFYTHSTIKGMDTIWAPWPLFHQLEWTEGDIAQTRRQFFYFLYWKQEQRKISNPAAAPAVKLHMWPFVTYWDNGAGRRQYQVLSPLEVFFPDNREVRSSWSPLFALMRYDQPAPGHTKVSLLWNLISWEKEAPEGRTALRVGPLFKVEKTPAGRRFTLGSGLFGFRQTADRGGWHPFALEFSPHSTKLASTVR
jgi:hypothetical protein